MSNAEIVKQIADRNCLNCKHKKQFKSTKDIICTNGESPLANKVTSGHVVCDLHEKNDSEKRLL